MEQARAPGDLAYASAGIGGTQHLSAEMFKAAAQIDIRHIPYKGSGPAQADFLGHQVPLMVDSVTAGLPHVQNKKAVALAVTTAKRLPQLPDVPTVAESGYPGFERSAGRRCGASRHAAGGDELSEPADRPRAGHARDAEVLPRPRRRADADDARGDRQFISGEVKKWGEAVKQSGAQVD